MATPMNERLFSAWRLALLFAAPFVLASCTPTITRDRPPETTSIPAFPWPPALASAESKIPRNWLLTEVNPTQLSDVSAKLEAALQAAKYRKWSFSSVPNGFALVAQLEQIKPDGTPSPEPARWSADLPSARELNLLEFMKALANAEPGYYRVMVFIVTNQPWSRTGEVPTTKEAEVWLSKGFNKLPPSIGALPYEHDYSATVLVYEFKKTSKDADAAFLKSSQTRGEDHLKKAGISDPLSGLH